MRRIIVATSLLMALAIGVLGGGKVEVVITDGGNWALPYIDSLMVYPYNPESPPNGSEEVKPILVLEGLHDPVDFELPPGMYEIVIKVWKYGVEPVLIPLGEFQVQGEKMVLDLRKFKIPFEIFVPA